jgi:hypothetical protein
MARFNEQQVRDAFEPYLEPGETVERVAYGIKQPPMILIIAMYLIAVLPGAIALMLLTKEYVVALTDRRVLVLRFSGRLKVKELIEYSLADEHQTQSSTGMLFVHLKVRDPERPFVAKFHRLGLTNNRQNAQEISTALAA